MSCPRFITMSLFALVLLLPSWVNGQETAAACPRDIWFWADQSDKIVAVICPEGMQTLARRVISEANVYQWKMSDGSFETREDLAALSPADLVIALRDQLQHRDDETRDRAEAEYLVLLLNVCVGALPRDAIISTEVHEGIGHLVSSFEQALNENTDLDTWQQIVEQVNRGNIDAPECLDADQIFRHVVPCGN